MSIEITVVVQVADGDQRLVNVGRIESVLPVQPFDPELAGIVTSKDVDLIDLARTALARLVAEAADEADKQTRDLSSLLSAMTDPPA